MPANVASTCTRRAWEAPSNVVSKREPRDGISVRIYRDVGSDAGEPKIGGFSQEHILYRVFTCSPDDVET